MANEESPAKTDNSSHQQKPSNADTPKDEAVANDFAQRSIVNIFIRTLKKIITIITWNNIQILGMYCLLLMYLYIIYVTYHTLRMVFPDASIMDLITISYHRALYPHLSNIYFIRMFLSYIMVILVYPIVSVCSFCIFIWGRITGNLQKQQLFYISIAPLIVIILLYFISV